jgi:hypothetical protein
MKNIESGERCPYLRKVVMVFCEAYPVKKMVPLERVKSPSPCFGTQFEQCPLFAEVNAQMHPPSSKGAARRDSNGAPGPRIRP